MATKTVLITGANRGIGLAYTEHYVRQGWQVIASARNVDAADELKQLAPWKLVSLDTSDEASIQHAAATLKDTPIDVLLNNAGILEHTDLTSTTKADLMRQFEVNVTGPFLMTRAFLPQLRLAANARGHAVVAMMTSRMGSITDNTSGGYYGYRSSKTALNMVTRSLAHDLKRDNIACLLLHPGHVQTAMVHYTGTVSTTDAAAGLAKIIDNATLEDSAKGVIHYEGHTLPW